MKEKVISNIKTIRESKNFTEEFVASKLGINQSTYSKKENGDSEFTLSELVRLSEVMEVPLLRFMDLDIAKIINQQNHDNATGIVENLYNTNEAGYKLCIEQYKAENDFLKEQVKQLTEKLS